MIRAVILDFDDTLCLSEPACFDLENEVLTRLGRPKMSREIHIQTWGQPVFEVMPVRSPGVDIKAFLEVYKVVIAEFIASGRLDVIPDENYQTLDRLIKADKEIMLLTSRTHGEFAHMLEPGHLLASRVKAFYYRDNMEFHKPDPRAFAELLADSDLQPEECVYVGDSLSDAQAAQGAGLLFIASLESGLRQKQDFASLPVVAFINKFTELYEAVQAVDKPE